MLSMKRYSKLWASREKSKLKIIRAPYTSDSQSWLLSLESNSKDLKQKTYDHLSPALRDLNAHVLGGLGHFCFVLFLYYFKVSRRFFGISSLHWHKYKAGVLAGWRKIPERIGHYLHDACPYLCLAVPVLSVCIPKKILLSSSLTLNKVLIRQYL